MSRLSVLPIQIVFWLMCAHSLSCVGSRHLRPIIQSFPSENHPVLLFTAEELPTIRSRIERESYSSWWKWAKHKADEALTADYSENTLERKKSEYAKALAFAYVVTQDTIYAEKAKEVLETITSRCAGGNWGDIHTEMDAVPNYCQAYDMIVSYLENFPASHRIIQTKIYEEGHRLYTYWSLSELPQRP